MDMRRDFFMSLSDPVLTLDFFNFLNVKWLIILINFGVDGGTRTRDL